MKLWRTTVVYASGFAIDFEFRAPDVQTAWRIAREWHPGGTVGRPVEHAAAEDDHERREGRP